MQRETGSRVRPWDVLHYVRLYLVIHQCWKEIAQGMLLNVRIFSFHLVWQIHLSHNVILNVVMNEVVMAAVSGVTYYLAPAASPRCGERAQCALP